MPAMVKMRVTPRMPAKMRRSLSYRTRMMVAEDGDEFEVGPSDARILRKTKYAEDVVDRPMARRGRPPKAREPEPKPKQAAEADDAKQFEDRTVGELREMTEERSLNDHTVAELREMAEARGIELPPGYVPHGKLVAMLRGDNDGG